MERRKKEKKYYEIVHYSEAMHGGVVESYSAHSRSGTLSCLFGFSCLVVSLIVFFMWYGTTLPNLVFWLTLACGIGLTAHGVSELMTCSSFRQRVKNLKYDGDVTFGTVRSVYHAYRLWGRTIGTSKGDVVGVETGWYWKVWYTFYDGVQYRKSVGIIPDDVGPQRTKSNDRSSTFLDLDRPKKGSTVEVLFNCSESVILRIAEPKQGL